MAQGVIDSTLYGIFRDEDILPIKAYQSACGLKPDGMVGSHTIKRIYEDIAGYPMPRSELWSCLPYKYIINNIPSYLNKLRRANIKRVVFQIDKSSPDANGLPRYRWPLAALNAVLAAVSDSGIEIGIMSYIWPHRKYIDAVSGYVAGLDLDAADFFELDLEHNWRGEELDDPRLPSLNKAAAYFWDAFRNLKARRGTTTYPFHGENSPHASISGDERISAIAPQAYSGLKVGQAEYRVGGIFGPGRMQATTYRLARSLGKPIVLGLPLFDQVGLCGDGPRCALDAAYMAARVLKAPAVRFWADKHLWSGKHGKAYAREWLYDLGDIQRSKR